MPRSFMSRGVWPSASLAAVASAFFGLTFARPAPHVHAAPCRHSLDPAPQPPPPPARQADLNKFVQTAADNGLYVTLRIGPYVCAEYYYGGIPVWMRDSGAACYRCNDSVWEQEMQRFVAIVVDKVAPQLYTNGGPIVMLQIENEYNDSEQDYLEWSVDMARSLTTEVPWNLCHDERRCALVHTWVAKGAGEETGPPHAGQPNPGMSPRSTPPAALFPISR